MNLVSTDVESAEMKTGLMCIQCNSVLKRDSLFEEDVGSNLPQPNGVDGGRADRKGC